MPTLVKNKNKNEKNKKLSSKVLEKHLQRITESKENIRYKLYSVQWHISIDGSVQVKWLNIVE